MGDATTRAAPIAQRLTTAAATISGYGPGYYGTGYGYYGGPRVGIGVARSASVAGRAWLKVKNPKAPAATRATVLGRERNLKSELVG